VVDLPSGCQFEFRYLVDGRWLLDTYADGFSAGLDGTENSIVDACLPAEELVLEQWTSQVWQEQTSDGFRPADPTRTHGEDCNRRQNPTRKMFTLTLWQIWQYRSRARG
jgi:hypothetical protein